MTIIYHNDKIFYPIVISLTILQFLDLASTYFGMNLGAYEANVFLKYHVENQKWLVPIIVKIAFISFAILPAIILRKKFESFNAKWQSALIAQFSAIYFLNWMFLCLVFDNIITMFWLM